MTSTRILSLHPRPTVTTVGLEGLRPGQVLWTCFRGPMHNEPVVLPTPHYLLWVFRGQDGAVFSMSDTWELDDQGNRTGRLALGHPMFRRFSQRNDRYYISFEDWGQPALLGFYWVDEILAGLEPEWWDNKPQLAWWEPERMLIEQEGRRARREGPVTQ